MLSVAVLNDVAPPEGHKNVIYFLFFTSVQISYTDKELNKHTALLNASYESNRKLQIAKKNKLPMTAINKGCHDIQHTDIHHNYIQHIKCHLFFVLYLSTSIIHRQGTKQAFECFV
jgi:hypothetical protein